MDELFSFLSIAENDPKIGPSHISLYLTLWKKWKESGTGIPLSFFRREVTGLCKISSSQTFHKALRELHEYGYVRYKSSFNRFEGSTVEFFVILKSVKYGLPNNNNDNDSRK